MCSLDYDPPTLYVRKLITARKSHRCCECGRTIEPAEQYQRVVGVWDGTFGGHTTCTQCVAAADLLMTHCHGFAHCGIYDDIREHVDRSIPWGMKAARFAVGMTRKWRRFDGNGLMNAPEVPR